MAEGLRHQATKVTHVIASGAKQSTATRNTETWIASLALLAMTSADASLCRLPAPDRRHRHLLAAAGAAIDLLAGAELEILVHADTHFAEPRPVAGHGNRRTAQAGIGLDEGFLDLGRRHGLRSRQFEIVFWDFHRRTRLADGLEIGPRAQSRAGAVLVPLTEDQPRRRHQVQHRGHDIAIEPRCRPLAIVRKAVLILRPQAVHH